MRVGEGWVMLVVRELQYDWVVSASNVGCLIGLH